MKWLLFTIRPKSNSVVTLYTCGCTCVYVCTSHDYTIVPIPLETSLPGKIGGKLAHLDTYEL